MSSSYSSNIVRKSVETDDATYATVLPDQTCDKPLIPKSNPIKQLDWKISLGKGCTYLPEEGIYAKNVEIGYGSWINGSIFGRENITLESGSSSRGGGIINGSVLSEGTVKIKTPEWKKEEFKQDYLYIKGDIIGENINISAPVIVQGNIIAHDAVEISEKSTIFGGIFSKNRLIAKNMVSSFIIGKDILLGENTSVFAPYIVASSQLNMNKVRIISGICTKCKNSNKKDNFHCNFESCEQCLYLTSEDIITKGNHKIASHTWRTYFEDNNNYAPLNEIFAKLHNKKKEEVSFGKQKFSELSENERQTIIQNIQSMVMGDYVSEKIDGDKIISTEGNYIESGATVISDSIINRSTIDSSEKEETKKGTIKDTNTGNAVISDSIINRSTISSSEKDETKTGTTEDKNTGNAVISDSIINRSTISSSEKDETKTDDAENIKCKKCNTTVPEGHKFCTKCGTKME